MSRMTPSWVQCLPSHWFNVCLTGNFRNHRLTAYNTASTFKNHKILYNLFKRVFAQSLVHSKAGDILGSNSFFQALNEI